MQKMECPCGYVYDPAEGDPEHNIPPGTPFSDLPEDWVCPRCGAEKEYFYPMKKTIVSEVKKLAVVCDDSPCCHAKNGKMLYVPHIFHTVVFNSFV